MLKRILLILTIGLLGCSHASAQTPFTCEDQFFLTLSNALPSLNEVTIDPQTKASTFRVIKANLATSINAIGYRVTDNYIYGLNPDSRQLLRVDATGAVTVLTTLPLNTMNAYYAGDVTTDGRYLVLLGSRQFFGGQTSTIDLVKVDLTSPTYATTVIPVNQTSMIFDIAFHPLTGVLYAFDGEQQRLVTINVDQGLINFDFASAGRPFVTGSLFFDAYGNLFAYGSNSFFSEQNSLYYINVSNGQSTLIATGAVADVSDGCSCPYTIELSKSVTPQQVLPCGEIEYTFTITNASARPHTDIVLNDDLPAGFTFVSVVSNPLNGVVISQPGDASFQIEDIDLPMGETKVVIRVRVTDAVAPGTYKNQATLANIPAALGSVRRSDDLGTVLIDDSTSVEVLGLPFETANSVATLCEGNEDITLDPTVYGLPAGATFVWQSGETPSQLVVDQPGMYQVTVYAGCDSAVITYPVGISAITATINTIDNQQINLGDALALDATVTNTSSQTLVTWLNPQLGSLSCTNCLTPSAQPFQNITYTLIASNELGCTATDSITIRVDKNRDVYFPNVFKPQLINAENASFYASGDAFTKLAVLEVYTRWGELVYRKNDMALNDFSIGWDGTHRGRSMNPGVYAWRAVVQYLDGAQQVVTGDVTLVR